jgi:hypothetical protein
MQIAGGFLGRWSPVIIYALYYWNEGASSSMSDVDRDVILECCWIIF